MIVFDPIMGARLKHRGEEVKAVREKHQRPKVRDEGNKWKLDYRDYSSGVPQRRSKVWSKSKVRSQREAQRLADIFMEEVNERNNAPHLASEDPTDAPTETKPTEGAGDGRPLTLSQLKEKCMELSWPLLKKSTQANYEFFFSSYLIPRFGDRKIDELSTMEFQAYFNSLLGKVSPYTICNMHAALRAALTQAKTWDLIERNTAIGVKLPKKKPSKPTQLLTFPQIKAVIEHLPEPTKTIVTLIVFGSMRVGEALALRWNDILEDCIVIDERLYDGDLDDPKTLHGNREVPFDGQGVMKAALARIWQESKHHEPDDFVFATRVGTPTERRNVLRHLKATAKEVGVPKGIDFRSFRTMHASLMRRTGARPEVARDNMGHSEILMTLEGYSRTWWDERASAVSAVVEMVMNSDSTDNNQQQKEASERRMLFQPEPEEIANGAPSGALAPKVVHAQLVESTVSH
ncbi:MAG TPA: tyrosine-type recombinase/integrase [Terracidiphilus sp.]|nr:tyrosine-type recombinase/integrase [Terracidiphilus sp.]